MKIYSFLLFLSGYVLLPSAAVSQTQAGFYIPPDTVSAMQEPDKMPQIRKMPQNYNRSGAPDTTERRTGIPRGSLPRQPEMPTGQPANIKVPSVAQIIPTKPINKKMQPALHSTQTAQPAVINYKKTPGSQNMRQAPVDAILAKQPLPKNRLEHYKKSIIRSFALLPKDLKAVLQKELRSIDYETKSMQQIKAGWERQTSVYKFANYQLIEQIDRGIITSRKNYKQRKQVFANLLKNAPADQYISVIESTDDLFNNIHHVTQSAPNASPKMKDTIVKFVGGHVPASGSTRNYYVSIFDYEYNHVFSYRRTHVDSNQNRRILAAKSGNKEIDKYFQSLFDDYRADLRRIGYGLDITNPILLRQIGEMQNRVITVEF